MDRDSEVFASQRKDPLKENRVFIVYEEEQ